MVFPVPSKSAQRVESAFPFWCLMFFTFVLFIAPQAIFPILQPLYLAKVSAGLAALVYVMNRLSRGRRLTVVVPEVRLILWLVFLAVLSVPLSLWPGGSLDLLLNQFLKSIIIFFLISNLVDTVRRMKLLIGSLILWGIIIAVTAVRNFSTGNLAVQGIRISGYSSPLAANPNDLALTLNMILALAIGFYFAARNLFLRISLLAVMGLLAGGVIASFSRGGFLGLATILIALLIDRVRERGIAILAPLLVFLMLGLFVLPEGYGNRLYSIYDFSYDYNPSAQSRWEQKGTALKAMLNHPLGVGLGVDTLGLREEGLDAWAVVHDIYLQIGVELGIPGLAIFLLLIVRMLKGLRLSLRRLKGLQAARPLYALGRGVGMCLLAFLVTATFAPVAWHFYFYYIAGFAVAIQRMTKQPSAQLPKVG